jgi:hypothetical protein
MPNTMRRFLLTAAALLLNQLDVQGAVIVTPVGTPGYQVTDLHLFAAPTGAQAQQTFQALFPAHFPRVPHQPPYNQELATGLALTGYREGDVFDVSEFTAPSGVYLGFVVVPGPGAPTGSSPDFLSGPIIPVGIQPIRIRGDVFLDGALFEQSPGAFSLNLTSVAGIDGGSHFVVALFEDSSFASPGLTDLTGAYEYRLTLRDANGNGYNALAQFQVAAVPEPSTLASAGIAGLIGCGVAWRRRRRAV